MQQPTAAPSELVQQTPWFCAPQVIFVVMYPILCGIAYSSDENRDTIQKYYNFIVLSTLSGISLVSLPFAQHRPAQSSAQSTITCLSPLVLHWLTCLLPVCVCCKYVSSSNTVCVATQLTGTLNSIPGSQLTLCVCVCMCVCVCVLRSYL